MSIIVTLENISKQYSTKTLISNVSFKIKQGEITTLIGPNGAGKTTIAKLILGLETPTSGKITIDPNLKIGYVPQKLNFTSNIPLTTESFLSLIAPNYEDVDNLCSLDFINIDQIKDKDINHLSLGQLQKLVIIATILNKPDIIILDEPIQSLDVISQQEFYKLIEKIKKQYNTTFFMISHDLFTVMKNSDQVICLNGHICCSGRPGDNNLDQTFIDTLSSLSLYNHKHDHRHN